MTEGKVTDSGGTASGRRGYAWVSSVGSAVALVASGVSLWETVLKQPQLKVYVGESISYTRDPYGSFEVFSVPLTADDAGEHTATIEQALEYKDKHASICYGADWYHGADQSTDLVVTCSFYDHYASVWSVEW